MAAPRSPRATGGGWGRPRDDGPPASPYPMAISARQYADAVGTAEATAPAPAPARPSRIAAARRAELAAEAAATGGNDVLLTVPAIMAEPVRTPSATVRSHSNGGRVEEYQSGWPPHCGGDSQERTPDPQCKAAWRRSKITICLWH